MRRKTARLFALAFAVVLTLVGALPALATSTADTASGGGTTSSSGGGVERTENGAGIDPNG
jgi:hypothetical protein